MALDGSDLGDPPLDDRPLDDPPLDAPRLDGRTARRHRTRTAIVEAVVELLEEGDLTPTGARIAERAGISLRSIGLHFEDREALLGAVAGHVLSGILEGLVEVDPSGTLDERLDAFLDQRAAVLEAMTAVSRAATVHEASSPWLRSHRQDMLAIGRAELKRVFVRELRLGDDLDAELLAAADAAAGWNTWWWLRSSGLDEEAAQRVVRRLLASLFRA